MWWLWNYDTDGIHAVTLNRGNAAVAVGRGPDIDSAVKDLCRSLRRRHDLEAAAATRAHYLRPSRVNRSPPAAPESH